MNHEKSQEFDNNIEKNENKPKRVIDNFIKLDNKNLKIEPESENKFLLDKDLWYTKMFRKIWSKIPEIKINENFINESFHRIAFLKLDNERKKEVVAIVLSDSKSDKLYWTEIILSALIATFGLLQNSVAVIIGAMLIAPLLRPIQGMAFGIATGQSSFFIRSGKLLLNSVIISIGIGLIVTWLTPITETSIMAKDSEVLARTAPNLLDLFIAIFSALVALLSLSFSRLSESVAGVAMAASLAPPLVVVGIELSFGNYGLAWGSLFLFLTNLLAILIVGILVFFVYGYSPHQEQNQKNMIKKSAILLATTLVISIPLFSSLVKISDGLKLESQSKVILEEVLSKKSSSSKIAEFEVKNFNDEEIQLYSVIKIPENSEFFEEFKHEIQLRLSQELERQVSLDIEIIRIANIIAHKKLKDNFENNFKTIFRNNFEVKFPKISIVSQELQEFNQDEFNKWIIKTIISIPPGETIDKSIKIDLEGDLIEKFSDKVLDFIWIPVQQTTLFSTSKEKITPEQKLQEVLYIQWENFFAKNLSDNFFIDRLFITWKLKSKIKDDSELVDINLNNLANISLNFDLFANDKNADLSILEAQIEDYARTFLPTQVDLNYRVIYFEAKKIKIGNTKNEDILNLEAQIEKLLEEKAVELNVLDLTMPDKISSEL